MFISVISCHYTSPGLDNDAHTQKYRSGKRPENGVHGGFGFLQRCIMREIVHNASTLAWWNMATFVTHICLHYNYTMYNNPQQNLLRLTKWQQIHVITFHFLEWYPVDWLQNVNNPLYAVDSPQVLFIFWKIHKIYILKLLTFDHEQNELHRSELRSNNK